MTAMLHVLDMVVSYTHTVFASKMMLSIMQGLVALTEAALLRVNYHTKKHYCKTFWLGAMPSSVCACNIFCGLGRTRLMLHIAHAV